MDSAFSLLLQFAQALEREAASRDPERVEATDAALARLAETSVLPALRPYVQAAPGALRDIRARVPFAPQLYALALIRPALALAHALAEDAPGLAASPAAGNGDVAVAPDLVENLPLLAGVLPATRAEFLRAGRIVSFGRGAFLCAQGAATDAVAIVLEGWVRLTRSDSEGGEVVAHMAGRGDGLLAQEGLENAVCFLGAQAVSSTRLLVIPGAVFWPKLALDPALARNLLLALQRRSRDLAAQVELLALRDATQRVGAWLLRRRQETGADAGPITLPFDKAAVAAALNIKPETFSRVLQKLTQDGFAIARNRITPPSPRALCGWCDADIAARCPHADEADCPFHARAAGGASPEARTRHAS